MGVTCSSAALGTSARPGYLRSRRVTDLISAAMARAPAPALALALARVLPHQPPSDGTRPPEKMSRCIKIHEIPFRDHANNVSLMVFWAPSDQPLPPLYSFAIYVTCPDIASPDLFDAADLLRALCESSYAPETNAYRLDVYFAPWATVEHCKKHYDAERAARGLYTEQTEALRNPIGWRGSAASDTSAAPGARQRLPGLVPSYLRPPAVCHHDVLFICDEPEWPEGDDLCFVQFRPASTLDEFGLGGGGGGAQQQQLDETPEFVADTATQLLPVCPDPEEYDGSGTVQGKMYDMLLLKDEQLSEPYEEAMARGWRSW